MNKISILKKSFRCPYNRANDNPYKSAKSAVPAKAFFLLASRQYMRRIVLPLTDLLGGGPSRDHGGSP